MTKQLAAGETAEQDDAPEGGFSSSYRTYVLIILTSVYAINVVDRNILTILLQSIKLDLQLSDTQLGLLTGFAFAIFYALFALPIAMWADRSKRGNILALTTTVFSCVTILCGFVTNFVQIMTARILIATGEAGTNPCAHSMISDTYPPKKRASALGIYAAGANIGILIGFIVGGWVNQFYGWRAAFFVVGVPGLLLALLVKLTLKEPKRGHADGRTTEGERAAPGLMKVLRLLWSQHSFRHIMCGVVILAVAISSLNVWFPAFLIRSYHMTTGEIGSILALILGVVGGLGAILSGQLADRLGKRDLRWNVWLVAIINAIAFPFCIAMYSVNSKVAALLLLLYPALAFSAYVAPMIAMTQALSAVRMRAQATAIFFLIQNILGAGLGPQLAGFLSDHFTPTYGAEALRHTLFIMSFFWIWSSLHFVLAARTLRSDIARVSDPAFTGM